MNRRSLLIAASTSLLARPLQAANPEWQARLVQGGLEEGHFNAALHIMLAPGWKTYWRVPGEGGIPPQINVTGANLESVEILSPLPSRIASDGGETIGYHDEVAFLIRMKPKSADAGLVAAVSAFFGVCEQICKPAKFESVLDFARAMPEANAFIASWQAKLPMPGTFITQATQEGNELTLNLSQTVDDIFIEGPEELYFRAPTFSQGRASVKIDGLQEGQSLKGTSLRCTAAMQAKGLEQKITVS